MHAVMHCKTASHLVTLDTLIAGKAPVDSADRHGLVGWAAFAVCVLIAVLVRFAACRLR